MTNNDINQKFKRNKNLIRIKMLEYIPTLILSNLSTLLILSVDGLVVGNFIGADALASINIFYPVTVLMGVISAIVSNGTATCLSTYIVKNDLESLAYKKRAIKYALLIALLVVIIVQFPIIEIIIHSYHLEPKIHDMTMQYATGMMIAMPFSLISAVGLCQLQIIGRMKILLFFSILEGIINLLVDLFCIGYLKVGVGGAGYGTAAASVVRASLTIIYLYKKTDIYKNDSVKCRLSDIREIVHCGLPEASSILIRAFQSYMIMKIILLGFGETGGSIKAICTFCYTLANVLITSSQGAMRPLIGLLYGENDRVGLKNTMRISIRQITIACGLITLLIMLKPNLFYHIHGVKDIPCGGIESLRFDALQYLFIGYNTIFRAYFANTKHANFATRVTLIGNLSLVAFAYLLYKNFSAPHIFISEVLTASLVFIIFIIKYFYYDIKEKEKEENAEKKLYLSVRQQDAEEASEYIEKYAEKNGISKDIAYRIGLCIEEMVNYEVKAHKHLDIYNQITISFKDDGAKFIMLDDGECISLNDNKEQQNLIIDNYTMLKKLAKNYKYQYILNMNCTTLEF